MSFLHFDDEFIEDPKAGIRHKIRRAVSLRKVMVLAERKDDEIWHFVSQWDLFRASGVAVRADGAEKIRFLVGTRYWPCSQYLPLSPFQAAHDMMRKTGNFSPEFPLVFPTMRPTDTFTIEIPGAPKLAEVILWGVADVP